MAITLTTLTAIGGQEWQKGAMHRVYFNDLAEWYGLDVEYYGSGAVCSAHLNGEKISNAAAKSILFALSQTKIWYDVTTDTWMHKTVDRKLADAIIRNIKTAADQQ